MTEEAFTEGPKATGQDDLTTLLARSIMRIEPALDALRDDLAGLRNRILSVEEKQRNPYVRR